MLRTMTGDEDPQNWCKSPMIVPGMFALLIVAVVPILVFGGGSLIRTILLSVLSGVH
jgi:hypothetical protein